MVKLDYKTQKRLPTMEELPFQDGKPVDSEIQDLIAHLLKSILAYICGKKEKWCDPAVSDAPGLDLQIRTIGYLFYSKYSNHQKLEVITDVHDNSSK